MLHLCRRAALALCLLCLAGTAGAASQYYAKISGAPSSITCATTTFSFGTGATLSWNLMQGSTEIADVTAFVNGTQVGTQSFNFPALTGQAGLEQVNGQVSYPAQPFPYTLSVNIVPRDPATDGVSVSFSCPSSHGTGFATAVLPAPDANLSATPPSLSFPATPIGSTSSAQTVTINNTGNADATGVTVTLNNTTDFSLTANTCGATISQGTSCTLSVAFKPSTAGGRAGTVTVSRNYGSGTSFGVNGIGMAQLSLSASQLSFASQAVGTTSAAQVVTLTNTGASAVTVGSVTSDTPTEFPVTTTCTVVQPAANCTVSVTFKPAQDGVRAATITIQSNGVGSPQAIGASGTGTSSAAPGQLALTGSTSFGSQAVGSPSAPMVVTATNVGGTPVTVASVVSSAPAEFAISNNVCATVNAGAQCTFSVTFTPAAVGARAAAITVTSNGVGSPQVVNATGTGTNGQAPGQLTLAGSLAFGNQVVGTTSAPLGVTATNTGGTPVTVSNVASSVPAEFAVSSPGCTTLGPGAACNISVTFTPAAAGARNAVITVTSNGVGSPQAVNASGTGTVAPGQLAIAAAIDAGSVMVGTTSTANTVPVTNIGGAPVQVSSVSSNNPTEFTIVQSTCGTVNPGMDCAFSFTFAPSAVGVRNATVTVLSNGVGSPQAVAMSGTGTSTPPPPQQTINIIEYYHAEWDHYFMTGIPDEIQKLDAGVFAGWARTGKSFKALPLSSANSEVVCRFFSTSFAPKSSHFYTPFPNECNIVKQNSDWQFEGNVFNIAVPDVNGVCPAGTIPVYRLYNNGQGAAPNHRYTTDLTVRQQMIDAGWIPEGYGPIGVIMCAPA
jgi:hypothetical protein